MELNKIYDDLALKGVKKFGDSVKIRTGLFRDNDLVDIFSSGVFELYLQLNKSDVLDFMNNILLKIYQLPTTDSFNHMVDIFYLLQNEINNYYGSSSNKNIRLSFYINNGSKTDDEDARICSMSQIKGLGLAECAEKASLANNILLMLNSMGIFDYKVNYLNALTSINGSTPGGHAFLEFNKVNSLGKTIHIIYDVTNPETIIIDGKEYSYPAIYRLSENEYDEFLNGSSFDNSKFIMAKEYQLKGKREYFGFKKNNDYKERPQQLKNEVEQKIKEPTNYEYKEKVQQLKDEFIKDMEEFSNYDQKEKIQQLRNEVTKQMEEPANYDFNSSDDSFSDHMTLPINNRKNIHR